MPPDDEGTAPPTAPLGLISHFESSDRNVPQAQGLSSASGYYQITDPTWKDFAPQAGVDLEQFPRAIDAPKEIQDAVASKIYSKRGIQPWASNTRLMNALTGTGMGTGLGGSASLAPVEPLPNALFRPVALAAAAPETAPRIDIDLGSGGAPAAAPPPATSAMMALRVLSAMMAKTHQFTPVDYDPWKVAMAGKRGGSA